ncbi:hypothetical protein D3C81_1957240 [compost metagenome]
MSLPLVARAELMSMDTRASVGSITIEPPDGRSTTRWKAVSIWLSIWKRLNSGTLSSYSFTLLAYCGITWRMKVRASSWASMLSISTSPMSWRR